MSLVMSEPPHGCDYEAGDAAPTDHAAAQLHAQRLQALAQAEADTALPRGWPAWAALVAGLAAAASHFWPWGCAPGL